MAKNLSVLRTVKDVQKRFKNVGTTNHVLGNHQEVVEQILNRMLPTAISPHMAVTAPHNQKFITVAITITVYYCKRHYSTVL